ncbi:MAG: sodium:calcium antiporter [Planctomycetota bacterium]|nr:MAG: sodium:calcium antiporter [Planctomycetota bacterium]
MDSALLMEILWFIVGLVVLTVGAEWTVRGSSTLARIFGVRPIIIGITIVAFGTSSPELVVGVMASLNEASDSIQLAVGNVIGSNIANIGLILGISGLIYPIMVQREVLRVHLPLMTLVAALLLWFSYNDGQISRLEGGIFLGLGILINVLLIWQALRNQKIAKEIEHEVEVLPVGKKGGKGWNFGLLVVGLVGLVLGADWMVDSAVKIATRLGMSMITIGLTIVAVGTSLPELAASAMASFRKKSDIALGNVVGSNIYNVVLILGVVAILVPLPIKADALGTDLPVMMGFTLLAVFFLRTGRILERWEAGILFGCYVGYMVVLFLRSQGYETNLLRLLGVGI